MARLGGPTLHPRNRPLAPTVKSPAGASACVHGQTNSNRPDDTPDQEETPCTSPAITPPPRACGWHRTSSMTVAGQPPRPVDHPRQPPDTGARSATGSRATATRRRERTGGVRQGARRSRTTGRGPHPAAASVLRPRCAGPAPPVERPGRGRARPGRGRAGESGRRGSPRGDGRPGDGRLGGPPPPPAGAPGHRPPAHLDAVLTASLRPARLSAETRRADPRPGRERRWLRSPPCPGRRRPRRWWTSGWSGSTRALRQGCGGGGRVCSPPRASGGTSCRSPGT